MIKQEPISWQDFCLNASYSYYSSMNMAQTTPPLPPLQPLHRQQPSRPSYPIRTCDLNFQSSSLTEDVGEIIHFRPQEKILEPARTAQRAAGWCLHVLELQSIALDHLVRIG